MFTDASTPKSADGTGESYEPASGLKVRFLLTFDDGPHHCTSRVLQTLAVNSVQDEIKAVFFVQTRHPEGGGSAAGRVILKQEHQEGHVLGLHTGTATGHISHTSLSRMELERSLENGKKDLAAIMHRSPLLVRPPYWRYNARSLECYGRHDLHMLLSDVKAYDGINWGAHVFRRWNFRSQLNRVRNESRHVARRDREETRPVVVTFHDTNAYTADNLAEYLSLLIDEAERLGLPLHTKPFFDQPSDVLDGALQCAVHNPVPTFHSGMCVTTG
ncbi:polysaccharide deacetylase [Nitrospira sp. KM1]|uniref:polysaccharide deacetylase family protein n=1 Tax=Nitrospira sp. KM1 TaxID=1936990 RepID=UPI0013A747BA|nr:polysaccharide deacetylase family protein [Nitrospira sp. KM1]BCA55712.1 polysaccharide deacetylase [Nitrospira sp. KM1]